MIIMESAIAMNNDYIECSNTLGKIELFAEASYKEYEINLKEVALKVLKENGTEEDFDFLATEAATGYIERVKKAISKLIDSIVKFVRNCKTKLIDLMTNKKTTDAIDKAEDACKTNSKLRSTKVEYHNTDKRAGILKQGIDRINKKTAKIKAKGIATDQDIEEIEEIKTDTLKKAAAISVVAVATLGTVIALFKHHNSRTEIENDIDESKITNGCDVGSLNSDNTKDATTANFFVKSTGALVHLSRELVTLAVTKSTSVVNAIKGVFTNAKGKVKSENLEELVEESTDINDLIMFSQFNESTIEDDTTNTESNTETETIETESVSLGDVEGLNLDDYFTELCNDIFTPVVESTDDNTVNTTDVLDEGTVEESTESVTDNDDIATYMEQLEHDVFGTDEEVVEENTESDTDNTDNDHVDIATYMEQLEHDVFGTDEDVVEENTNSETTEDSTDSTNEETVTESTNDSVESLLDEMEALL